MTNDNHVITPSSSSTVPRTVFHEDDFTHPCHPLYVHPSDVLGTSLVSSPFDGTCYDSWRRNILVALSIRNKLDFISGSSTKLPLGSPLARQWQRCNNLVVSWLINSLSKEISRSVEYSESAKEIWCELEERYGKADGARIRVCTCGGKAAEDEEQKVYQFLMGLNDTYMQTHNNILMMKPLPSVGNPPFPSKVSFDGTRNSLICKYCKKPGHSIDKCYKLHGYPPHFKFNKGPPHRRSAAHVELDSHSANFVSGSSVGPTEHQESSVIPSLTKDQYSQLMTLLQQSQISASPHSPPLLASANFAGKLMPYEGVSYGACMLSSVNGIVCIIDPGATDHMTSIKSLLFDIITLPIPYLVSLLNGYKVKVTNVGSLALFPDLILHNGFSVKKLVVLGRLDIGLYKLFQHLFLLYLCSSLPVLSTIDADVNDNSFSFTCLICPLARQTRLPFHDSSIQSTHSFQLIHIDTWGPYSTPSHSGAKYFLTIVDDCTRATWTHLLGAKNNAFDLLKAFISMVETQFQTRVQIVRSDNALELGSSSSGALFFSEKASTLPSPVHVSYVPSSNPPPLRRSSRPHSVPVYLQDFVCSALPTSLSTPASSSSESLSFNATISQLHIPEPYTYS
uniref:Retrotransposon Copia-like N-terminal domain-containing protein n=2 Tax=Nicotiana TaxID=4085 RepID=A0A1S3ZWB2_TOBAC|nr:PREDICTED: uncharacterized protein LOC104249333 [Nicotiana sylvestris]XP_016468657.1 PREDICTED: uncharacterized protein LOC107791162 [Nicotiana tabacum]